MAGGSPPPTAAIHEEIDPGSRTPVAHSAAARTLLPHIVGFRIPIERLEGKWKLSQNHPPERRQKVAQALANSAREDDQAIAALMTTMHEQNDQ